MSVPGLPLAHRRVLITRPRAQAGELRRLLESLGAEVIEAPAIAFAPPSDQTPLEAAVRNLHRYDWVVLTSPNGVAALLAQLDAAGRSAQDLRVRRVAAIGPATAAALAGAGVRVDVVPHTRFQAEGLLESLRPRAEPGQRVLLVRAAEARSTLPDGLRAMGLDVEVVAAYRTVPAAAEPGPLRQMLHAGEVDAVTFTSGSTVHHLIDLLGLDALTGHDRPRVVCLGPVTADAAVARGVPVDGMAGQATMEALADAVVHVLAPRPPGAAPDAAPPGAPDSDALAPDAREPIR